MMAVSSNPIVRDLQNARELRLPARSRAPSTASPPACPASSRASARSTGSTPTTRRSAQENERLTTENERAKEIQRQNDLLTGLLQLQNAFEYKTVGRRGHRS